MEVKLINGNNEVFIVFRMGNVICFNELVVWVMGCSVVGVRGILLFFGEDWVVGMICIDLIDIEVIILVVFEKGNGKCFDFNDYCLINCGGKGVKMM